MTTRKVCVPPSPLTGPGGRATRPPRALDRGRVGLLGLLALVTLLALPGRGPAEARAADDGAVQALVHGPVDSRVFARLAPHLRLTPYSGQERAEEFDVVVLDGRAFTPDQVAQLELVDEALSAGTWVLLLNPTAAHKSEGLWARVHFATPGTTAAVMVRQRRSATGTPIFDIHEPISARLAVADDSGAIEPPPPRRVLREAQDDALADHLTRVLTAPEGEAGDAAPPLADTAIPPGLLSVQWHYTIPAATTFNYSFYRRGGPV
jgi:hypothetical protein